MELAQKIELGIEWTHARLTPGQWRLEKRNDRQEIATLDQQGEDWKPKVFSPFGGGYSTTKALSYREAKAWAEAEALKHWELTLSEGEENGPTI